MPILTKPSFAPSTAIIYVTAGALLDVWTAVYYFTFVRPATAEDHTTTMFWITGFFLTGVTFMVIGLVLGPIGRYARQAEMPPPEVTPRAVQAENEAQKPVIVPAPNQPAVAAPTIPPRDVARR